MSDQQMDGSGNYQSFGTSLNNQGYNSASALQIRLDTDIVEKFERYLLGAEVETTQDPETGQLIQHWVLKGKKVVNDIGYQAIMRWMNITINRASLQGNFLTEDIYWETLSDLCKDVLEDLMINRRRYDLHMKDFGPVMHGYLGCARVILTRPIFNKERDGMNNTTRIQETMQSQSQPRSFFNGIPFFGGKK